MPILSSTYRKQSGRVQLNRGRAFAAYLVLSRCCSCQSPTRWSLEPQTFELCFRCSCEECCAFATSFPTTVEVGLYHIVCPRFGSPCAPLYSRCGTPKPLERERGKKNPNGVINPPARYNARILGTATDPLQTLPNDVNNNSTVSGQVGNASTPAAAASHDWTSSMSIRKAIASV